MRARDILTFLGCLLWVGAGFGLLAVLLPAATMPSLRELALLAGCTALALATSAVRFEFRHGDQRLVTSPDVGFLVLAAVSTHPTWAALAGGVAVLWTARRDGSSLERAFHVASGALSVGTASIVSHELAPAATTHIDRVLPAVLAAAAVRAIVKLTGELLLAESRARGGALAVLRATPVGSILVLEAGLPAATVTAAGAFLDQPARALVVVLAGQLLTWRLLRLQHDLYRGSQVNRGLLDTFHRYVPRHVAAGILATPGDTAAPTMEGETRELSVMFIDVRGFTGWSERTAPAEVFSELNHLLGELADAILTTEGTIDKFTGDGLMAFWGAPSDQPDHAVRAVQTLPKLLMRVREFNLRREVQRATPLEIGIGISTGPAMVGNIGHRDRLAYTAIGDTVNLAARLEKATKAHGVPALIDEGTFLALPIQVQRQLGRLDSIEVKGRRDRVRLYAPVALLRQAREAERDTRVS